MQIGPTELLIILIVVIVALGYYRTKPTPPVHPSSQQARSSRTGDGNPDDAGSANPRNQPGSTGTASAKDPYVVLNIPRNATQDEINAAYRKLAQMYHPDKVAGLAPEYYEIAETKMKDINAAYEQIRQQPGARR